MLHVKRLVLTRISQVDWTTAKEAKLRSELITPLLILLGYGEHTDHPVLEEESYSLADPYVAKGSRRVRLDYEPTVRKHRLWIIEAKSAAKPVEKKTLGQARDYALHPEVMAAFMVVVDRDGFAVYDPWEAYWDEPLLAVSLSDIEKRFSEISDLLATDRVSAAIRKRHVKYITRAIGSELDLRVLDQAEREFKAALDEARASVQSNRKKFVERETKEAEDRHKRVLESAGVWGIVQHENQPFPGNLKPVDDFVAVIRGLPPNERSIAISRTWHGVTPPFDGTRSDDDPPRPLWWVRVVVLGAMLRLRGVEGCEPIATEWAKKGLNDHFRGFPDDPVQRASHGLQLVSIPLSSRLLPAAVDLEKRARDAASEMSAETILRFGFNSGWIYFQEMRSMNIKLLWELEPFTVEHLNKTRDQMAQQLDRFPAEPGRFTPAGDPGFKSWEQTDPLKKASLVLIQQNDADDLLNELALEDGDLNDARTL